MTDQSLLEELRSGSAQAFRALVARYAGLVRTSALRQVRDQHVADDVTQAVFIVLARRAATIRDAAVLPAWLIRTAHFASRDARKLEARRRKHEQKAAEMAPTRTEASAADDPDFADLAPVLDAALAKLKTVERNVVARRYLQQQTVEQIALELKMTEAAVRKRLSRAMPKLRTYLSRRGLTMSIAGLSAALFKPPPAEAAADAAMVEATANAALAAVEGATLAGSAASIASAVLLRARLARVAAVIALFLVLALIGGAGYALRRGGATSASSAVPPFEKIKLGIMLSDYTITGPTGAHMGGGFDGLNIGFQRTDDPQIERFAIVEPGTASNASIATMIKRFFPPGNVIDGSRPDELRKLDVIACFSATNMRDDVLDAMIQVVRDDGLGMLNQVSTGCNRPGLGERTDLINGMTRYGCLFYDGAWPCDVLADQSLIAELKPMIGRRKISLEGNFSGSLGVLPDGAVPLLAAPGVPNHHPIDKPIPANTIFYPLYTSHLGKGRILGLQWTGAQNDLEAMTSGKFYVRCIQWLANKPLDP